jgi:transcriptional regulator with XRE-family HTH domain
MLCQRLKRVRLARGLSLDALSAEMGGFVTKQALSKYERGLSVPSPRVLNLMANVLGVKPAWLWSEPKISVELIAFRKGSQLRVHDREHVESMVMEELEERVHLQELMGIQNDGLPLKKYVVRSLEETEAAALGIRKQWHLGLDPISNVTDVLEHHSVHVIAIEAPPKFDGLSAIAYGEGGAPLAAAVVTRGGVPGERQRLNLTHELGHLALRVETGVDEEKAAFRFGGAFLAPEDVLKKEVGQKRGSVSWEELMALKRRFGMSAQALLYRMKDLGILTEAYAGQWQAAIRRRGQHIHEPNEMPAEQPQWLTQTVLRALAEGALSHSDAARLLGQPTESKPPLSLAERKAFLRLPMEERRRILAEQAGRLTSHYETDDERIRLDGGGGIEYK